MFRPMQLLAAALIALPGAAVAQSTLLQGGAWSTGHVPMYVGQTGGQTIVQDSGPASGGGPGIGASEFNITARGTGTAPYVGQGTGPNGEVMCVNDAPTTNSTGYHSLCFSANVASGGLISYQANGAASALPFRFKVNGVNYEFPFTTTGVIGPASSVIGDAACWNNTSGTLLADCGPFVTVAGNNTWTGTNNFTGPFQVGGVVQNFPASGNIVGTSDVQTITNKSIGASQINSGTLPAVVMPAFTGDVTNPAGSLVTTIANGAVTNAKMAVATQNTIKGAATSTAIADLAVPSCSGGSNALQWVTNTGLQCATLGATTAGWGLTLSGGGVFSVATAAPPFGLDMPVNMGLAAGVGGNALTITLTTQSGGTPSATDPVLIPFRSTTLATGTAVWAAITSTLTIVIPSAATLGTSSSNVPFRIWIYATYNAGAPQLGVALCSAASVIYPCTSWETTRKTTVAIGGFSTSAGVLYSPAAVTTDAVRIIGYAEYASGLATAGAWASVPTTLQVMSPGVKKSGEVVQTVWSGPISTTTTINSGATQTGVTASITPTSAANLVEASAQVQAANTAAASISFNISRGAGPTLVGNTVYLTTSVSVNASFPLYVLDRPSSASALSYYIYGSGSGASAGTVNTIGTSSIKLQEIMSSLEPANDNVNPGVFSAAG